jgi:hypothetical protein
MSTGRESWFADVLSAGLDTRVVVEPDIVAHVTPATLASAMPREVMVKLFEQALSSGTMSPIAVVETATPALLAAHVTHSLLWTCVAQAAQRAGLVDGSAPVTEEAREFLRRCLDSGLKNQVFAPKDIVQEVNAQVLGHLPDTLAAKLLEASLASGKMTPELVVETLGVADIARNAPTNVVWACIAKAADGSSATTAAPAPRPAVTSPPITSASASTASGNADNPRTVKIPPAKSTTMPPRPATLEVMDDDIASVFVDLEAESAGPTETSVMKPMPQPPEEKVKKGLFGRAKQ